MLLSTGECISKKNIEWRCLRLVNSHSLSREHTTDYVEQKGILKFHHQRSCPQLPTPQHRSLQPNCFHKHTRDTSSKENRMGILTKIQSLGVIRRSRTVTDTLYIYIYVGLYIVHLYFDTLINHYITMIYYMWESELKSMH